MSNVSAFSNSLGKVSSAESSSCAGSWNVAILKLPRTGFNHVGRLYRYLISGNRFIYRQVIIWVVDAKKTRVSQVFYILEYIEKESCHLDKYFVK
jgi:hypothetical protein